MEHDFCYEDSMVYLYLVFLFNFKSIFEKFKMFFIFNIFLNKKYFKKLLYNNNNNKYTVRNEEVPEVGSPLLLQPLLLPKICPQSNKQFLFTRAKTINLSISLSISNNLVASMVKLMFKLSMSEHLSWEKGSSKFFHCAMKSLL